MQVLLRPRLSFEPLTKAHPGASSVLMMNSAPGGPQGAGDFLSSLPQPDAEAKVATSMITTPAPFNIRPRELAREYRKPSHGCAATIPPRERRDRRMCDLCLKGPPPFFRGSRPEPKACAPAPSPGAVIFRHLGCSLKQRNDGTPGII